MVFLCGWGSAERGQLGRDADPALAPVPSAINVSSPSIKVTQIAAGDEFLLCLTDSGAVYSCGANDFGQLGFDADGDSKEGDARRSYFCLKRVEGPLSKEKVTNIYAGCYHAFAITSSGAAYGWGWNADGQLGVAPCRRTAEPRLVSSLAGKTVKQICCGQEFSLILTDSGELFSLGSFDIGKRVRGDPGKGDLAKVAGIDEKIASVACGAWHVLALSVKGKLHSWGFNDSGQLGSGNERNHGKPIAVQFKQMKGRLVHIACGRFHSFAQTDKGTLLSWGSGLFGQLGIGPTTSSVTQPSTVQIPSGKKVKRVFAGLGDHSFVLCDDGVVYAFGSNDSGQLGLGDLDNRHTPCKVDVSVKKLASICVGFRCSFLLSDSGTIQTVALSQSVQDSIDVATAAARKPLSVSIEFDEPTSPLRQTPVDSPVFLPPPGGPPGAFSPPPAYESERKSRQDEDARQAGQEGSTSAVPEAVGADESAGASEAGGAVAKKKKKGINGDGVRSDSSEKKGVKKRKKERSERESESAEADHGGLGSDDEMGSAVKSKKKKAPKEKVADDIAGFGSDSEGAGVQGVEVKKKKKRLVSEDAEEDGTGSKKRDAVPEAEDGGSESKSKTKKKKKRLVSEDAQEDGTGSKKRDAVPEAEDGSSESKSKTKSAGSSSKKKGAKGKADAGTESEPSGDGDQLQDDSHKEKKKSKEKTKEKDKKAKEKHSKVDKSKEKHKKYQTMKPSSASGDGAADGRPRGLSR